MAPIMEVAPFLSPEPCWIEVAGEELRTCREPLLETLEAVCRSPIFVSSPKSSAFIRHVVLRTLSGDVDELKERLIGMLLLGRDASYDTSTDSGVRVRANDVRKRLAKFNEHHAAELELAITLPAGSYIPRVFRTGGMKEAITHQPPAILQDHERVPSNFIAPVVPLNDAEPVSHPAPLLELAPQLSFFQLVAPTLAAIFLCIVCMRWQLSQEHAYTTFWGQILQGDYALLYLTPNHTADKQGLVAIQELNEAAPLLDLAGRFHRQFTVMSTPPAADATSPMVLHLGLDATGNLHPSSRADNQEINERFFLAKSANDRVILDRKNPNDAASHHAALLTIINGPQRAIYIDGTDDDAIRSVVNRLCNESTFPRNLADSLHPGTITQVVFPSEAYAKGILDRQPITSKRAALDHLP
jgi:hypothetical protein